MGRSSERVVMAEKKEGGEGAGLSTGTEALIVGPETLGKP